MIEVKAKENSKEKYVNVLDLMGDISLSIYTSVYVLKNLVNNKFADGNYHTIKNITLINEDDLKNFLNGADLNLSRFCNRIVLKYTNNENLDSIYIKGFVSYIKLFLTQQVLNNILRWQNENRDFITNEDAVNISEDIISTYIPLAINTLSDRIWNDIISNLKIDR